MAALTRNGRGPPAVRAVERVLAHQALRFSVLDEQISREDLAIADEFGKSDVIFGEVR